MLREFAAAAAFIRRSTWRSIFMRPQERVSAQSRRKALLIGMSLGDLRALFMFPVDEREAQRAPD